MKITDIKCAVIASSPVIRITTDEGITGWSQIETPKPYLQPIVLHLKAWLVGQDPVNVERVMRRIRVRGGFKPWGAAVSARGLRSFGPGTGNGGGASLSSAAGSGSR